MSEKCSMPSCEQLSYDLCHGCKVNFCQEHMNEHCSLTHLKYKPLTNEVNEINIQLKKLDLKTLLHKLTINRVHSSPSSQQWFSCTCSSASLYLSTTISNISLVEFQLLPTIRYVKKWASDIICKNDEAIDGIIYHNNTFALTISNDVKRIVRFELRSAETLEKIWSLPLDIIYNKKQAFRFCLINYNDWIVADHCNSRLLHITKDGQIKSTVSYKPSPCCVSQFGNDILAISTKSVVHLHKL